MAKSSVLIVTERLVSFLGSISSILGLLIALPAALVAYKAGKEAGKEERNEPNIT
jgi:hypothetical protein